MGPEMEEVSKPIDLNDIIIQIEQRKAVIAHQRDKLQELQEQLSDTIESFDSGVETLEDSLDILRSAIDSLSESV